MLDIDQLTHLQSNSSTMSNVFWKEWHTSQPTKSNPECRISNLTNNEKLKFTFLQMNRTSQKRKFRLV